jgi:hypothetical protein
MNDGGGGDDSSRGRGGFRGGGPSGSNVRGGPPPFVPDRGFSRGRGRGRGRGGWMGRGRGFGGMDFGGFTGSFRGGRPMYHQMDETDFEIHQRGEFTGSLIARVFLHTHRISQTNRHKADAVPPVGEVEDHHQNPARAVHLEDVEAAVVVGVSPRNLHLPHHCQAVGMKNGRCYGPSSLLGLPRPPHFFKRPRNFSNLLFRT